MTGSTPWRPSEPSGSGSAPTSVRWMRQARGGDDGAVERLVERYLPSFRAWASHRLPRWARDGLDTEDLVQDTLLRTIRHVRDVEPRRERALLAYMRQALRNRIRDEIRRASRRAPPASLASQQPDGGPTPLQEALGHELLSRYESALERLSPEDREAILARVELKHGWRDVALELGKSTPDAARKAVGRALRRLAEEMVDGG